MTTVPNQSTDINSSITPGENPSTELKDNKPTKSAAIKNNSAEAIKFIKEKLNDSFDEKSARILFNYYTINDKTMKLEPTDIRKLMFDILSANNWPLVVPDECLDMVLNELCLNDHGCISWIEFKSFFVFLQDRPLLKLFQICKKLFTKQELEYGRLIFIQPVQSSVVVNNDNNSNSNGSSAAVMSDISYDRQPWHQAISELLPDATNIFIFFLTSDSILAFVIGPFTSALSETAHAEICMNDTYTYMAEMRAFDVANDVFPPIARSGGIKSKVARKLADSYVIAKKWDNKNFQLRVKTHQFVKNVNCKWREIDEKFKVKEKVNKTAENFMCAVKSFDEKHQISTRVSTSAKEFDAKYKWSEKAMSTMAKIKSNETFQKVTHKVSETVNHTLQTVSDISHETQQLVRAQTQDEIQVELNENVNENEENDGNYELLLDDEQEQQLVAEESSFVKDGNGGEVLEESEQQVLPNIENVQQL